MSYSRLLVLPLEGVRSLLAWCSQLLSVDGGVGLCVILYDTTTNNTTTTLSYLLSIYSGIFVLSVVVVVDYN